MRKRSIILFLTILIMISGFLLLNYFEEVSTLKHETSMWAIIQDTEGNLISIESNSNNFWEQITQVYNNKTEGFIGSNVELYDNKWGFRFNSENITIEKSVNEELQFTIKEISNNITHFKLNFDKIYTSAKITNIYNAQETQNNLIHLLFEANLNFSALLLAVIGLSLSLYVKAEHKKWKPIFKKLLVVFLSVFLMSMISCILSLFYIIVGFSLAPTFLFNLLVVLFFLNLILLIFTGLFLVLKVIT